MKKVGYFFFCFLPLLASIGLQLIAAIPVVGVCLMQLCSHIVLSGEKMDYFEFMTQFSNALQTAGFSAMPSIVFAACGIVIFGAWYACQFHGDLSHPQKICSKPVLLLAVIFLVPGLQMVSGILTNISATFFPGWMDFYEKLMENAGLTQSPSLLLTLYAVLLGPIEEELTFRGVILSSAKRALPFWAANLFQAILFGLFHMNLIQGIYAFFIGICLGYVCERGGSIWLSIFLHILFNLWGTVLSTSSLFYESPMFIILFYALSIPLGILGLYLFHKNSSKASVNDFPYISDM